jgi:hypothetical protein
MQDRTTYDLRSGMNITLPQMRTTTYQNSFYPQSIKDWNELEVGIRNCETIGSFKDHLKRRSSYTINKLDHHNSNKAAINQTRRRLGLSGLSFQRFDYKHIDSPMCDLRNTVKEDTTHFFLTCPSHNAFRNDILNGVCEIL